jgi:hypothetical protein
MAEVKITIDMTPTWEFSMNVLTQSVAGKLEDNEESRKSSAAEIVRAGKLLDTLIAHRKQTAVELESIRKHFDVLTQSGHTSGYDWNTDPEGLTLIVGEIYGDIQHVLDQLT